MTGHETFHSHVEQSFPLFKCTEGHWKLKRLARASYPAWRQNYIDKDGNWLNKEARKLKRKFKREEGSVPPLKKPKGDHVSF